MQLHKYSENKLQTHSKNTRPISLILPSESLISFIFCMRFLCNGSNESSSLNTSDTCSAVSNFNVNIASLYVCDLLFNFLRTNCTKLLSTNNLSLFSNYLLLLHLPFYTNMEISFRSLKTLNHFLF